MFWDLYKWSDKYCLQILLNLAPAIMKGSTVMRVTVTGKLNHEPEAEEGLVTPRGFFVSKV